MIVQNSVVHLIDSLSTTNEGLPGTKCQGTSDKSLDFPSRLPFIPL